MLFDVCTFQIDSNFWVHEMYNCDNVVKLFFPTTEITRHEHLFMTIHKSSSDDFVDIRIRSEFD